MKKYAEGGIYTADMGQPPMDPEGGSVPPRRKPIPAAKKPAVKRPPKRPEGIFREGMDVPQDIDGGSVKGMSRGGSASSRGDGIAQRGKTRGTFVMCGGGYTKGKK
jgi:hypothetical protein